MKRRKKIVRKRLSNEFKDLLMGMYEGFPNVRFGQELIHKRIILEKDREMLVRYGYLIKEMVIVKGRNKWQYNLGPNALNLITAWKMEEMTKQNVNLGKDIRYVTFWLYILTAVLVVLEISRFIATK